MANVEVAFANTVLSNADEVRPDGGVTFEQMPEDYATNTYGANGAITGTRYIKRWKKTTSLVPKAQDSFDKQLDISLESNEYALQQIRTLNDLVTQRLSLASLPAHRASPVAPTLNLTGPDAGTFPVETIGAADLTAHITATRDAILERLEYQYTIDHDAAVASLANQGLFPGMVAYDRAMLAIDRKNNDARLQAFLVAQQEQTRIVQLEGMKGEFANGVSDKKFQRQVLIFQFRNMAQVQQLSVLVEAANYVNTLRQQQLQELIVERTQPMNEIGALVHGGQIQVPQFQSFKAGTIAQTPVAESVYRSAEMDMQKWQAKVQQQQSMMGGLMGLAGNLISLPMMMSDRRLKADIVHLLDDARGFGWYAWRYVWDAPSVRRVGVMAQELARVMPEAVALMPNGFLAVDYAAVNGPH